MGLQYYTHSVSLFKCGIWAPMRHDTDRLSTPRANVVLVQNPHWPRSRTQSAVGMQGKDCAHECLVLRPAIPSLLLARVASTLQELGFPKPAQKRDQVPSPPVSHNRQHYRLSRRKSNRNTGNTRRQVALAQRLSHSRAHAISISSPWRFEICSHRIVSLRFWTVFGLGSAISDREFSVLG